MIVQMNVALHAPPGLSRACILIYVDLVVLEAAPEALNDDVVRGAAFAIHTDSNVILFQQIDILRTRKMAALIAIDNAGLTPRKRPSHRLQHKADLQALVELPVDDITRIPIHDGEQVHPALCHADIRDVHRPHLIRLCNWQLP